jgi:hypothetical protein
MLLGYRWYLLEMTSNKMMKIGEIVPSDGVLVSNVFSQLSENSGSWMLLQAEGEEFVEEREDILGKVSNRRPTCSQTFILLVIYVSSTPRGISFDLNSYPCWFIS